MQEYRDEYFSMVLESILEARQESGAEESQAKLREIMIANLEKLSDEILANWENSLGKTLRQKNRTRKQFERRLYKAWGEAISSLELLQEKSLELGSAFNEEFRPEAAKTNDLAFDVLSRLHGRSCLVATEIIVLLKAGLASGAMSRWRTLYEIAVVGFLIAEHGHDLAERYIYHTNIQAYKAAKDYEKLFREHKESFEKGGHERIEKEELERLEDTYNELCVKYGKEYKNPYGWAAKVTGNKSPTFRDLEELALLSHFRPYYRIASTGVHAPPGGLLFDLGKPSEIREGEFILAGPSFHGLETPGQNTAISLMQITVAFINQNPKMEYLAGLKAILALADVTQKSFLKIYEEAKAGGMIASSSWKQLGSN